MRAWKKETIVGVIWGLVSGLLYLRIVLDWYSTPFTSIKHKEVHFFWKILLLPSWILDQLFIENIPFGVYFISRRSDEYLFYFDSAVVGGILGFIVIVPLMSLVKWRRGRKEQ